MKKTYMAVSLLMLVVTACSNPDQGRVATSTQQQTQTATPAASKEASPVNTNKPDTKEVPIPRPTLSPSPSPLSTASSPPKVLNAAVSEGAKPDHVVIVVEENHSYEKLIGNASAPYINALAGQGAFFTHSYAVAHPSQPNYFVLFSGSDQGVKNDSCGHEFKAANLASELVKAGYSFAGYSEDLPAIGSTVCTNHQYGRKHSPWVSFSNVAKESNQPFDQFPKDFSKLPTVSFVIPNQDNDMHDGTILPADEWLKKHIGPYVTWAQSHNSLLILTWDEDDNSKDNHIPTIFVGPMVKPAQYDQRITHLNVLRSLEELYKLPYMGGTAEVPAIQGIWK
ncbi:alkaline phosphatase family protein [Paenibacillus sp. Soil787]|uniref:alkaline phosphatase family protein n=1 Tax=Paenibacillus sp. Soil787 TaxID=1736411 RepID=UPI000B1F2D37|nr:alkaline phosphatase family protein [Paenibacillus sp. Soil787]